MSDTPAEVERIYRDLLLQRPPEERVSMAASMFATARSLVRAAVLEADPCASETTIREELFRRFYAMEFDQESRERIIHAIRRAGEPTTRAVPVDWDQLELSLTLRDPGVKSYLDLRSGAVQSVSWPTPDPQWELPEDEVERGVAERWLVLIEPVSSSDEYRWMKDFAASVGDARLRAHLEAALVGKGVFRRFQQALGQRSVREQWFAFRDARVREAARRWLADHAVVAATDQTPRAQSGPDTRADRPGSARRT